jgi:phage shock protein E
MSERFKRLIDQVRREVPEIDATEAQRLSQSGEAVLIDVREKEDWEKARACGAIHLSKGIVELEIEETVPDLDRKIVCYCGGGSRSLLAAENLRRMGYRHVYSLKGGFRAWNASGLPTEG